MWEFITNPTVRFLFGLLWSAVVFLAGAYCGYRFNVRKDKRGEFNELANRLRPEIEDEMHDPDPMREIFKREDVYDLLFYTWPWKRKRLKALIDQYHEEKGKGQITGGKWAGLMNYIDPEPISAIAKQIRPYLEKR